jgi:ubiquinone/menaquinone biosynthesis C-methylase UbiE
MIKPAVEQGTSLSAGIRPRVVTLRSSWYKSGRKYTRNPRPAMLNRILETEVMDSADEARAYDEMDHSVVNGLFVEDFLRHFPGNGPVLDVGTGTAQIPIELCRRHPAVKVHAVDASRAMLERATQNIARAGLRNRIETSLVDAKRLPFADGHFPAVMSNSIIHHIPEPRIVFAEMIRVTAPGGIVFIRDLLRPETELELRGLVDRYAGDCDAHQRQLFADSLHAALSLDELRSLIADLGFNPAAVERTSDRHWTFTGKL